MQARFFDIALRLFVIGALLAGVLMSLLGCASAPKVCAVSPIDIEGTLADSRDIEAQLVEQRKRLAAAQADLAEWEGKLAERRAEVPRLRAELARLKKMSGRKEEDEERGPVRERSDEELFDLRSFRSDG